MVLKALPEDIALAGLRSFRVNQPGINGGIGIVKDFRGEIFSPLKNYQPSSVSATYLPTLGDPKFIECSKKFLYGDFSEKIVVAQCIGGTAGLRLALHAYGLELKQTINVKRPTVLLADPAWPIYESIATESNFEILRYNHRSDSNGLFDIDTLLAGLNAIPSSSAVILQTSGHNPTGTDPAACDWDHILQVIVSRNLRLILDIAYHGIGGSFESERKILKKIIARKIPHYTAYSFSKNLGIYSSRLGLCASYSPSDCQKIFESHLSHLCTALWLSPSSAGVDLAVAAMEDPVYHEQWVHNLKEVREHLHVIRRDLSMFLANQGFNVVSLIKGQGIFCTLPLTQREVIRLRDKWNILIHPTYSRLCLAALNYENLQLFKEAFQEVKQAFDTDSSDLFERSASKGYI